MSGRAGLELVRQLVPGRLLERDRADHVAAAQERRHRLEQRSPAVEHADAGRAVQLVAGGDVEVAVRAPARRPACDTPPASRRPAPARRAACASRTIVAIGLIVPSAFDMCVTRQQPRPRREQRARARRGSSSPRSSIGATRRRAPLSSQSSCQGTMLEWCSIAVMSTSSPGCDAPAAERVRDEVDALGGVAGEDDLAGRRGVEERAAPSRAPPRRPRSPAR